MPRSLREMIEDYTADPARWEVVKTEIVPSANLRNRGGKSVHELFRHKMSGEQMVLHTLLRPDGGDFAPPHFHPS